MDFRFVADLPAPQAVVDTSSEQWRNLLLREVVAADATISLRETDPSIAIIDSVGGVLHLHAGLVNVTALQQLTRYAVGANLDNRGAEKGLRRNVGEADDTFRERILRAPLLEVNTLSTRAVIANAAEASGLVFDANMEYTGTADTATTIVTDVYVHADPAITSNGVLSAGVLTSIKNYLEDGSRAFVAQRFNVTSPAATPYFVSMTLTFNGTITNQTAVIAAARNVLSTFNRSNFRFARGVRYSPLIGSLLAINGVTSANIVRFTTSTTMMTAVADIAAGIASVAYLTDPAAAVISATAD